MPLDRYRLTAIILGLGLLFAAATDYVPAFRSADGKVFGLFALDVYKDALHVASAAWALLAAALSRNAAMQFLRIFGTLYFLDGVMGVFTGSGYLDLSILIEGVRDSSLTVKVLSSLPHLMLGALGIVVGWSPWRETAAGARA